MKSIFLTGSKGFIGSHLLKRLNEMPEYSVFCAGHNELPVLEFDYIIHLAATTTTSDSFIPELFENNIVYAKQIMSIPTRIIYASSTSAAELTNPYAYTKQYIEWLALGKDATGLRFFNVYGPDNNKGIVKKAIECAKNGEPITISGGYQKRDFIHVDDVCRIIIESLDSKEKIINVGTGIETPIWKAINTISEVLKAKIEVKYIDASNTDMHTSVACPGIPGCLTFEDGLSKMLAI